MSSSIKNLKNGYFSNRFKQYDADSKRTWKVINYILLLNSIKSNSFELDLSGKIT